MSVKTFLLLVLLGFSCIQSGVSLVYTCNPSASCGCSKGSMMVSRIVNGETAEIDAWTWAVSLKIGEGLCGASILSPSWIITAAHCLREVQVSDITVHAGSNNIWSNRQIKTASSIVLHPNYNPSAFTSDIALIKLASPLDMKGSKLRTICLPSVDSASLANKEWPEPNTTVVAVGWGRLSETGSISIPLQQVSLETIDYRASVCNRLISDRQVQMCASASNGSKDTCQGDSGGPLMMFSSSNQWILVGLTSFGDGCARRNSAGVYTRVASFRDWITATMDSSGCKQTFSMFFLSIIIFLHLQGI